MVRFQEVYFQERFYIMKLADQFVIFSDNVFKNPTLDINRRQRRHLNGVKNTESETICIIQVFVT